jgi:phosphate transport system substrate-binding protein
MKKLLLSAGLVAGLAGAAHAADSVTVKGSDTMVILNQRWAEAFMAKNPGTTIQVTGGGSGTGLSALINGTTDIAAASRNIKDSENEKVRERFNTLAKEIPVAKDGVAVYLNAANPVKSLTMEQVKDIYTGKIDNWKAVGGNDEKIIPYGRENNSGTYVFVKEHVLGGKDFAPRTQTLPGTGAVVNAVAKDKRAIGYGGGAYAKGVKETAISDGKGEALLPTEANVASGKYALSRDLYFYVRATPTGAMKTFIDWVLSAEGQAIVTKVGYYPIAAK